MSSPPALPVEVLRTPTGARVLSLRGLLTVRLDDAQCAELCRLLCDDEPEPAPV
ncbi:hypothetical protein [Acrocarpospora sp. B8E8]|uniref:hypothetical protein n=1 Tax=Acrocarpospora sp. B8E8 TaxID=3153572 RepID=UPI00325CF9CA